MKLKYIIFPFIALLLGSACSLEEQIFDTPAERNYIQSEEDVTSLLNGAYGILQDVFKFDGFKLIQFAADDISSTVVNFNDISQKAFDPANTNVTEVYNDAYRIINNCNWIIDRVPDMNLNDTYKKRVDGEAKFLRGFSYFYLVRLFGGVPLRTVPTSIEGDFGKTRASVGEIYELIFSDLEVAAELLPLKSVAPIGGLGRTDRGAAQAMLSLAYLTYANHRDLAGETDVAEDFYQLAKDYADSVITSGQYHLLDDYADLWDVEKEAQAYQEVIFGVEYTRDASIALRASKGSEFAFRFMPNSLPNVSGQGVNRTGSGHAKIQPWFHEFYTAGDYAGDYRTEVTFLTSWTNPNGINRFTFPVVPSSGAPQENQSYLNKYRDGNANDNRNHENDWFVIRLSEVYLIRAEAENALSGPTAEAYDDFNKLRERARKADGVARATPEDLAPGLTQDEFRMKIFEERGLEFVGEGKRWFDLVRMKSPTGTTMFEYMFGTVLPDVPAGLPVWNGPSRSWQGGRKENSNLPAYNARLLLFPIPLRETDLNPLIEQNPGYF